MKASDFYSIDGVFPAVKCAKCSAIYDAGSEDYIAFYGSVALGLQRVIVGVDPPQRPKKKAMAAVCRTPECLGVLVRELLGCAPDDEGAGALWSQVLAIWTGAETEKDAKAGTPPPAPKRSRSRKK